MAIRLIYIIYILKKTPFSEIVFEIEKASFMRTQKKYILRPNFFSFYFLITYGICQKRMYFFL